MKNTSRSGLCCPGRPQSKILKKVKRNKYLDFAKEVGKLWNMKVTVIPIVIDALRTIPQGLVKELEELELREEVEIIQNTSLLRSARILRRILEILEDLLSLKIQ